MRKENHGGFSGLRPFPPWGQIYVGRCSSTANLTKVLGRIFESSFHLPSVINNWGDGRGKEPRSKLENVSTV